jgi:hypothetical protein
MRDPRPEETMTTDKQLSLKPVAGTIVLASPSDSALHRITPRDRALSAMTDLRQRAPVTVHRDVGIDDAPRQMMHAGGSTPLGVAQLSCFAA